MNRETPLQTERIVSVDFFRGLAIFAVALIHSIMFGVFYTIDNTLAVIPLPLLIVLAPLVLLAPLADSFYKRRRRRDSSLRTVRNKKDRLCRFALPKASDC